MKVRVFLSIYFEDYAKQKFCTRISEDWCYDNTSTRYENVTKENLQAFTPFVTRFEGEDRVNFREMREIPDELWAYHALQVMKK